MKIKYVSQNASESTDKKYRYWLYRQWVQPDAHSSPDYSKEPATCLFVMLNPSTVDAMTDDPTVRRCVGFASRWGYCAMAIVNLFAYRTADPKELLSCNHHDNIVGDRNLNAVEDAAWEAHKVVCAWGNHGAYLGQDETCLGWLENTNTPIQCLGKTKQGQPQHPLYLPYDTQLQNMWPH